MAVQWSLVLFTVLSGTGAWMFAIYGIDKLRGAKDSARSAFATLIAALVLVIGGGLCSVTHLSHPDRMLAALNHPTSGIFVEAVLVGLLVVAIAVVMIMVKRNAEGGAFKAVLALGIIFAIALSFCAGQSYCMEARPAWNNVALPLAYMTTVAVSGAAGRMLVRAINGELADEAALAGKMLCGISAVALVSAVAFGAVSGIFASEYLVAYVFAVLVVGTLLPAILGVLMGSKADSAALSCGLALAAALIGAVALRAIMWLIGVGIIDCFGVIL